MAEPIDIVRDFCAACEGGDIDAIVDFFTDDAVYHNIPVAAVQGKDAIRATFDMFTTGVDKIEFRVLNISAAGNTVLTERVDVFVLPTGRSSCRSWGRSSWSTGRSRRGATTSTSTSTCRSYRSSSARTASIVSASAGDLSGR